jgi:hypothetical protein
VNKFFSTRQTFGTQTPKKYSHANVLEALVHWLLAFSVKAEQTNFDSPPIKLLESLVRLTNGHSVKCPSLSSQHLIQVPPNFSLQQQFVQFLWVCLDSGYQTGHCLVLVLKSQE